MKPAALPLAALQQRLRTTAPDSRLIVAYSGGVDSHVLLHWLISHREPQWPDVTAAHVHHGLAAQADAWTEHCVRVCEAFGIPLSVLRVDATPLPGDSPEAAARHARYRALRRLLGRGHILLTGHHLADQAETVLLQLLRGGGVHGLAAMPARVTFGAGELWRPLLEIGRHALMAYAKQHALSWVDDPSNRDHRYQRNFLRDQIVPRIETVWPSANATLARVARHCAETASLLDDLAASDLAPVLLSDTALCIDALQQLAPRRQRNVLRYWLRGAGFDLPSSAHLQRIRVDLLDSAGDREPCVRWEGTELRRFRRVLHVMRPLPPVDARWSRSIVPLQPVRLPDGSEIALVSGGPLSASRLQGGALTVGFRRGGERLRLAGSIHRRPLKKLFQESQVPGWERARTPILFRDGVPIAVAGKWISADYVTSSEESGYHLQWQKAHASGSL